MKKWLKRIGITLGVIVGLLVAFVVTLQIISIVREGKEYQVAGLDVAVPSDAASIEEGDRLFRARGCAECHGQDGGGKVVLDDPGIGRLVAPNLTVLGTSFSTQDFERAIRSGISPQGRPYLFMPSHEFRPMPDVELGAIIAFVRSLPRVTRDNGAMSLGPVGRALGVLGVFPLIPAEEIDYAAPVTRPTPGTPAYGAYLGSGCSGCHGATLSGGPIPGAPVEEVGIPPNITPHATGLAAWNEDQFRALIREGRRPDGTRVNEKFMPYPVYAYMTDAEIQDLWGFLRAQPALEEGNR